VPLDAPDRYAYSAITQRPPIAWPDGKRLAFWVATNHEFYELDPPPNPSRKAWPRVQPDVLAYSQRDYGNRVGIWRLLDLCDRHGVRGSISWNVALGEHHPETTEPFLERGWEFFSHGIYNTRFVFGMNEEDERQVIQDSADSIRRLTGQPPTGYLAPALTYTERTFDLVAEAGFQYTCDLFHDDQPFPVKVRSGRLISVPYTLELNDVYVYNVHHYPPAYYGQMIRDQFDILYAEGGRVMCVAIHPYLVDQPHRQQAFEEALAYVVSHDDVWVTTGAEIAQWYYDNHYDEVARAVGHPAP
jgi:allantoinase